MGQSLSDLPDDVESLRAIIAAQAEELARQSQKLHSRDTLFEKLKAQLAVLRRARFGGSSEKIERLIEQLELALEDIETADAEIESSVRSTSGGREKAKPSRQPLLCESPVTLAIERIDQWVASFGVLFRVR